MSRLIILSLVVVGLTTQAFARNDGDWGTVKGQVVVAGPAPQQQALNVNKDQEHCLSKGPILDEEWVVNPKNNGLRWVFVWLAPEKGAPPLPIHPSLQQIKEKEVSIDQPCCKFEPHAVALRQGQTLVAKNSAPIAHSVRWTGHPIAVPGGNLIVPAKNHIEIKDLKAHMFPIEIKCDIHPWMKAYARVFDHPYFAVTDENGNFEIKNAPAGQYRLLIWHDSGFGPGLREGKPITIKGGAATDAGKIEMNPKR